ncbi:MAG: biotin/lipoyl-binding protein, partial [Chloroflexota bacterium]
MRVGRVHGFVGLGLAVTLLAGCGALGGNGTTPSANQGVRPATVVSAVKAFTGPISEVASYTGNVQPADTVNVVPQISGRVVKLNVDVGSQVKTGDVIAELDTTTLNAQVAQAQAGVDSAQVKLQQIQAGARPEAIDAANANAQSAEAKLQVIQNGPRSETVAEAKAALDTAKAKLAVIQQGARPENVAQAKANLDAAQAKLKQLTDGPTADQVAAAQLQVEQAKDSLTAAQAT